jgi:hypothetical protein
VSQAEPAHTRGAIISDLACIVAEISDIQVEHAKLTERTAVLQSRVGRMIRDLSCTTAPVRPGADLQGMRERLGEVRGRLEATAETIKNSAGRTASAAQAAPPPTLAPSAQDAATPVRAGKALDEAPAEGAGKGSAAGQSRECVTSAGAGGESAASADTAPAADVPRVPRREPEVRNAGGGLVQDGGSTKIFKQPLQPVGTVKDKVLDRYAEHGESAVEIAAALQLTKGSVSGNLSIGRTGKDPRVEAGDRKRSELLTRAQRQPTPRDIADSAKPVETKPPPAPPQHKPVPATAPAERVEIPAGKLIAIRGAEVHGPSGVWRISKETAKAFGLMADGQLYGLETMARHGGLNPRVCEGLIGMWTAALAKIGIALIHHKGAGMRLKPIGASA